MGLARRTSWKLPRNLEPREKVRCITLLLPDDDEYELLLRSAIYDEFCLTWMCWQRDGTRNGQNQVELWRRVLATWKRCEETPTIIEGVDTDMTDKLIDIKCDSSGVCHLYIRCDVCSDTWNEVANIGDLVSGLPGQPQPQPPSGGGQQCYQVNFQANSLGNVPTVVNTGDVLTIQSAQGAGSFNGVGWWCVDGSSYFAGACVGGGTTDAGDPVPATLRMALILQIGSSYYYTPVGTPFTVPSGITNQPINILANYGSGGSPTLSGLSGSYQVSICRTNNAAATWSHDVDFTLTPDGWSFNTTTVSNLPLANYNPGTGWQGVYNADGISPNANDLAIFHPSVGATFTNVRITTNATEPFTFHLQYDGDIHTVGATTVSSPAVGSGAQTTTVAAPFTPTNNIGLNLGLFTFPGDISLLLVQAHFEGTGANPFA